MDTNWFYADNNRQRQGPVDAARIRALLGDGTLGRDSLVWRQGMGGWETIAQKAAELGLEAPAGATADVDAPPPAPRAEPGIGAASAAAAPPRDALASAYAAPATDASRLGPGDHADVVDAGFWRRAAAFMIDNFLLQFAVYALIAIGLLAVGGGLDGLKAMFDPTGQSEPPTAVLVVIILGAYVLPFVMRSLYFVLFTRSSWQATLGKRAMGIKVVDLDGRKLGTGQAIGRWFAGALSYLTLYIGFAMAGFTDRKRALHDMVASTRVVDRWAYTDHPERQQRGVGATAIAVLVGGVLLTVVLVGGMMAAISIPAYQDYTRRAKLTALQAQASPMQYAIEEFVHQTDRCPTSFDEIGIAEPVDAALASTAIGEFDGGQCGIEMALADYEGAAWAGQYLWFTLDREQSTWTCSSSLEGPVLPVACQP